MSQSTSHSILMIQPGRSTGLLGNFSARLTVVDSDNGFEGMQTQQLTVSETPLALAASSTALTIIKGDSETTMLTLTNQIGSPETVALSGTLSPVVARSPAVSVNPSTFTLVGHATLYILLTVSTRHPTRTGNYNVTVTAITSTFSSSIQIQVTVIHR